MVRDVVRKTEERPMLDHQHRVLAEDALEKQALGIEGGRGHGHLYSRQVRKPCMEALGVLGPLPPALADDGANDDR